MTSGKFALVCTEILAICCTAKEILDLKSYIPFKMHNWCYTPSNFMGLDYNLP